MLFILKGKHQTKALLFINFLNGWSQKYFLIVSSNSHVVQCKEYFSKLLQENMKNTELFIAKTLLFNCHVYSLAQCPTATSEWDIGVWRTGYMTKSQWFTFNQVLSVIEWGIINRYVCWVLLISTKLISFGWRVTLTF